MKYSNNLLKRHLWRGEVGTSFSRSRPLPFIACDARPAGHSTSLCGDIIRNELDAMIYRPKELLHGFACTDSFCSTYRRDARARHHLAARNNLDQKESMHEK
jgi:hypothetical protein